LASRTSDGWAEESMPDLNTRSRSLWAESECAIQRTRIPQAALFREAVEDLLKKYEEPKKGKK